MNCIKFLVFGKVQKVFYRKSVSNILSLKGYIGYVKNLPDGSVEVVLKSSSVENIADILEILNEGSPKSEVSSVEMGSCSDDIKFSTRFEVRY